MNVSIEKPLAVIAAAAVILMPAHVAAETGHAPAAAAVDAEAAEALARRENCLKCHGIDKNKSAPAYMRIAAKYRNKEGAEEKIMVHLKSGEAVMLANGEEERHRIIKTTDENAVRNLIRWILSL